MLVQITSTIFTIQIRAHLSDFFSSSSFLMSGPRYGPARQSESGDGHLPAYLRHLPRSGAPGDSLARCLARVKAPSRLALVLLLATLAVAAARINADIREGCSLRRVCTGIYVR